MTGACEVWGVSKHTKRPSVWTSHNCGTLIEVPKIQQNLHSQWFGGGGLTLVPPLQGVDHVLSGW